MNQEKIADLKNWMHQEKIDFTYISDPGHIAYFSGYESGRPIIFIYTCIGSRRCRKE